MATTIDNRVVSIRFDNQAFERRISDTIKALGSLDQKLQMSDGTKGLKGVSEALSQVDTRAAQNGLSDLSAGFVAMSTIAITALSNITNRVVDMGLRLSKALSLDQVKEGFSEYELNMNSIQTILSNTASDGTTLEQVTEKLDELNRYSDETIYNFAEMTKNIGTFSAAGVDLETSVMSIKGIANLAAISGSDSNQAASAMYQLSQALASGTVKLMDWNSVVNAGMGGEVFQKALWETGKALGKITDSPVGETFDEWKERGNTFRESLQKEWLTSDVLTTTLQTFTGDLNAAQIEALGYTEEQALEFEKLGQNGKAAATEVKTITQLWSTMRESVGSSWSQSFKLVLGDFKEAKELLTGVSEAFGHIVEKSATARNSMLESWRAFGGRDAMINSLKNAFHALQAVLAPISKAFRSIFPRKTGQQMAIYTKVLEIITKRLIIGESTATKLGRVFSGLFSIFKIGIEIGKQLFRVIFGVVKSFGGAGSSALDFAAGAGDAIVRLREFLVEGGAIYRFFSRLESALKSVKSWLTETFESLPDLTKLPGLAMLVDIFESIVNKIRNIGDFGAVLETAFSGIEFVIDRVSAAIARMVDYVKRFASEAAGVLKSIFSTDPKDMGLDLLNVGLVGGLGLILKRIYNLFKDFSPASDLIETISGSFDQLTDTLGAMQANLKAEALMKIAIAVGILTGSLVLLSAIEPEKLTKSLTAVAAGFGLLVAAMALMNKASVDISGAARMGIAAVAMIGLAAAAGVLAVAVTILSRLEWDELARGLTGVGVSLGLLVGAVNLMPTKAILNAGLSMLPLTLSLVILAGAVKIFSMFDWDELIRGFAGVGIALGLLVGAINLFPSKQTLIAAISLGAIGLSLVILAGAVKIFSMFDWETMGRGFAGVAGILGIIVATMSLMPPTLPVTAAGLLLVGVALGYISSVVKSLGSMRLKDLVKGLGSIAAIMLILAVGVNAMSGALLGAAAMIVVAFALDILGGVVERLAKLELKELGIALLALVGIFVVIGVAALAMAPILPALIGLSVALIALGLGLTLFGAGAFLVAKALEVLIGIAQVSAKVMGNVIEFLAKLIPALIVGFVNGIIEGVAEILEALPSLIKAIVKVLGSLLDALVTLIPKVVKVLDTLITHLLKLLKDRGPEFIKAGFDIIVSLLKGMRDNIEDITKLSAEILTKFMDSLAEKIQPLIDSGTNLLKKFLEGISKNMGLVATAGGLVIKSFLRALGGQVKDIMSAGEDLVSDIIDSLADLLVEIAELGTSAFKELMTALSGSSEEILESTGELVDSIISGLGALPTRAAESGKNALIEFLKGLRGNITEIKEAATSLIVSFLYAIAGTATIVKNVGVWLLISFLDGLTSDVKKIASSIAGLVIAIITAIAEMSWIFIMAGTMILTSILDGISAGTEKIIKSATTFITTFITGLGTMAQEITDAGGDALESFLLGIADNLTKVCAAAQEVIRKFASCLGELKELIVDRGLEAVRSFVSGIFSNLGKVREKGLEMLRSLINGIVEGVPELYNSAFSLAKEFIRGLKDGLFGGGESVISAGQDLASGLVNTVKSFWGISSPSKVAQTIGRQITTGLAMGLESNEAHISAKSTAAKVRDALDSAASVVTSGVYGSMDLNPVITPKFDFSNIADGVRKFDKFRDLDFQVTTSIAADVADQVDAPASAETTEQTSVQYVQNNYSPKALNAEDIYRQSRSLIARAEGKVNDSRRVSH